MESNHPSVGLPRPAGFEDRTQFGDLRAYAGGLAKGCARAMVFAMVRGKSMPSLEEDGT